MTEAECKISHIAHQSVSRTSRYDAPDLHVFLSLSPFRRLWCVSVTVVIAHHLLDVTPQPTHVNIDLVRNAFLIHACRLVARVHSCQCSLSSLYSVNWTVCGWTVTSSTHTHALELLVFTLSTVVYMWHRCYLTSGWRQHDLSMDLDSPERWSKENVCRFLFDITDWLKVLIIQGSNKVKPKIKPFRWLKQPCVSMCFWIKCRKALSGLLYSD